jgi:EmrB/QacA subfamily drug resistance transporter
VERKWWTLIAVSVAIFMLLLDITVVNVALPSIQGSLKSSFSDLQWVVNAYALTLAAFLLTAGSVADLIGRRRVFTLGLIVFTASSAVCGLSTTPLMLNLARAVQGVGGAMMFSTSLALLAQAFHGRERGTAFGVFGAVTGAAVAVGPVVGGIITSGIGWEWIFFINVPIGIAAVAITLSRVVESSDPGARRVDWIGLVTFSGALFALVFALIEGNGDGWGSTKIVLLLIGALVLFIAFITAERMQSRPMLDLSLFRKPAFTGASIVAFSVSASIFAMFLYLTLYIQDVLGYTALQAGLRFLPITLLSFVAAPIAGRLSALPARRRPLARRCRPARDDRDRRDLRLDDSDPRFRGDGRGHRPDQPAAGLDGHRRGALLAQRHGLGHQQHLPPGRYRDRHRRARGRLPARRAANDDQLTRRAAAGGAGRGPRTPEHAAAVR